MPSPSGIRPSLKRAGSPPGLLPAPPFHSIFSFFFPTHSYQFDRIALDAGVLQLSLGAVNDVIAEFPRESLRSLCFSGVIRSEPVFANFKTCCFTFGVCGPCISFGGVLWRVNLMLGFFLEHRTGVEPVNTGFADQRVSHFATGAHTSAAQAAADELRSYLTRAAPPCADRA